APPGRCATPPAVAAPARRPAAARSRTPPAATTSDARRACTSPHPPRRAPHCLPASARSSAVAMRPATPAPAPARPACRPACGVPVRARPCAPHTGDPGMRHRPWPPPVRGWARWPRRSRWASPGRTGLHWTGARRRRTSPARTRTRPPATTASAGFARHATTLLDDLAQIPEQAGGIETGRIARQRRAVGLHQHGAHRVRLLRSPLRQLAVQVLAKLPEVGHAVVLFVDRRRAHVEQAQPRLVAVEHHAALGPRGQR